MGDLKISVFCFLASYTTTFLLECLRFFKPRDWQRWGILLATSAGFIAQTWYLFQRSAETNLPPLLGSTHDWFLVLAWITVLFYLFLNLAEQRLSFGLFILPIILVLIGSASYVSTSTNTVLANELAANQRGERNWVMLHASFLLFGIAGVIIGFVLALMYLIQHRRLKHKLPARSGLTLPNLERLSRWNWWAVVLSIPLLSLGVLTGVILGMISHSETVPISFSDPVVTITGVAWSVMIVFFFWLIRTQPSAGKQVAWRTLWAFGFLLLILIGLQLLTNGGDMSFETWHT